MDLQYMMIFVKVSKDIENVEIELRKMDGKRRIELRDNFTEKELKRMKELRIKLSKLESKQIETTTSHLRIKNNQSKAMGEKIKTFLSDQINHIDTIKRGLFDMEQYTSQLHTSCNHINNSYNYFTLYFF